MLAQRLQRNTIGDPEDPGRHSRRVAKFAGVLPHDHESIIDNLIDILRTWCQPRQKFSESLVVAEVELFERTAIAACNGSQPLVVRHIRLRLDTRRLRRQTAIFYSRLIALYMSAALFLE